MNGITGTKAGSGTNDDDNIFGDLSNMRVFDTFLLMPSQSTVTYFDDFVGDVVADQWNFVEGTDSATSAAAILSGGIGGVLRLTTGDAGTAFGVYIED